MGTLGCSCISILRTGHRQELQLAEIFLNSLILQCLPYGQWCQAPSGWRYLQGRSSHRFRHQHQRRQNCQGRSHVYRRGKKVIEIISSFFYCGRFVDCENTFGTAEEPGCMVPLEADAQVGVLQSKEWFEWENRENRSSSLLAGTSLIIHIQCPVNHPAGSQPPPP
ncbi:hypothetical protein K443DRAFT_315549 [Laccaria amethystina LaAM-08-1]|uniref:Uncharacterized protein n=1 Tax=Laccaria amethystina LaAM-08-1 TaxID=1095629 RepID=A0A0C9XDM2_9AGAR|nr:hypothetical protein K443DRAFT_315549 [Laccaria amethystina LaAM-08-1]